MEWVVAWVVLGAVAGMIAASKKLSFGKYLVIGFLFPPIGIVAAVLARPNADAVEQADLRRGDRIKCPHCAEVIKAEARVCRFCGRDIVEAREVFGVVVEESWNRSSAARPTAE